MQPGDRLRRHDALSAARAPDDRWFRESPVYLGDLNAFHQNLAACPARQVLTAVLARRALDRRARIGGRIKCWIRRLFGNGRLAEQPLATIGCHRSLLALSREARGRTRGCAATKPVSIPRNGRTRSAVWRAGSAQLPRAHARRYPRRRRGRPSGNALWLRRRCGRLECRIHPARRVELHKVRPGLVERRLHQNLFCYS
jgi:hypothetical protein